MSRSPRAAAIAANPVLIGAVTTLVVVVAVFLAYNANQGLPFVPTFQLNVDAPNAQRLVVGNEVREGGFRIGQISGIRTVRGPDGGTRARIELQLEEAATPVPVDSSILIRPRSALGLKYVELSRGSADRKLEQGAVIRASEAAIPPELDDFFNMFNEPTRAASRDNLEAFGGGLAGRGIAINRTLDVLPDLLGDLVPVARTLASERTDLEGFIDELEDAARTVAPVADSFALGFTAMADTFEAFSRDPQALKETISETVPTLEVGIETLPQQRELLDALADVSDEVSGTAAEIRRSAPVISRSLAVGTGILPQTVSLNEDLERALDALRDLANSPTTDLVLAGLTSTMQTLNPTLKWVGPHVTVCNYWNYWWTLLSDHLSEEVSTGTLQRIQAKSAPSQDDSLTRFGAAFPANEENVNPITEAIEGDAVALHAQAYGRAVNEEGLADCESGQRGYPDRLAEGVPERFDIVIDPRTPGLQGKTFTGRDRVPEGQTFSAEPTGDAPPVRPIGTGTGAPGVNP